MSSLIIRTLESKVKRELEDLEARLRSVLHPGSRFAVSEEVQKSIRIIEGHARQLAGESEASAEPAKAPSLGDAELTKGHDDAYGYRAELGQTEQLDRYSKQEEDLSKSKAAGDAAFSAANAGAPADATAPDNNQQSGL